MMMPEPVHATSRRRAEQCKAAREKMAACRYAVRRSVRLFERTPYARRKIRTKTRTAQRCGDSSAAKRKRENAMLPRLPPRQVDIRQRLPGGWPSHCDKVRESRAEQAGEQQVGERKVTNGATVSSRKCDGAH